MTTKRLAKSNRWNSGLLASKEIRAGTGSCHSYLSATIGSIEAAFVAG